MPKTKTGKCSDDNMRIKPVVLCAALLMSALVITTPASAVILNFGVNIGENGSFNGLSFFDGDDEGRTLNGSNPGLFLSLNTASVFGGYHINSAYLFVDAENVSDSDIGWVNVQGIGLGVLPNTAHLNTNVPLISGPPANSGHTPYNIDRDNSFYDLGGYSGSNLEDLVIAPEFLIKFRRDAGSFRIDGINIQADVSAINSSVIPEPVPLSLLVLGLLGLAGNKYRLYQRRLT